MKWMAILALLVGWTGRAAASAPHRDDRAHAELRRILANPEFREVNRARVVPAPDFAPATWLERWGDRMIRLRRAIHDWLFPRRDRDADREAPERSSFDALFLPVVCALVLIGVVILVLAILRKRRMHATAFRPAPVSAPAADWEDARQRDLPGWEAEAAAFFSQGRFRDAVRARYLGSLSFLSERGAIRYERFKTNGEYVSEIAARFPAGSRQFERLTFQFDGTWYGDRQIGPEEARSFFRDEESCRQAWPQ